MCQAPSQTHTLKNACRSRRDIFRAEKLTENRSVKHQRHPQRELEVSPSNQRFAVFPDLPGAEERRRVSAQHKGVPQGLHIIPRRGEYIFTHSGLSLRVLPLVSTSPNTEKRCFKGRVRVFERRHCNNKQWVRGADEPLTEGGGVREQSHIVRLHREARIVGIHYIF